MGQDDCKFGSWETFKVTAMLHWMALLTYSRYSWHVGVSVGRTQKVVVVAISLQVRVDYSLHDNSENALAAVW